LAETGCLLAQARLYIGPDTAVTHLAAAIGTPTIALFGPTDPRWAALHERPGNAREIQLLAEPFLPAEIVADRVAKFCGMHRISVGDVKHACLRLLGTNR
jgi:ADP-heptose:LPS heptosyltransferase